MMKRCMCGIVSLAIVSLAGCSSPRSEVSLSQILRDLEADRESQSAEMQYQGGDAPEMPAAPLPEPGGAADMDFGFLGEDGKASITIQPDSVVRISVQEDPGLGGTFPVNEIGAIQLGYIGPVILYNMTEGQAELKIKSILESREFLTATIDVQILRASYDKIRVAGAVKRPGLIRLGAGDAVTLNNALVQAGGIVYPAKTTKVKVVREGLLSAVSHSMRGEEYRLVDVEGKPSVPDVKLRNNDVVYVFSAHERKRMEPARWVLVLGEVNQAGFVRFQPSERFTIMNLIFKLGGLPPYANDRSIRVIRTDMTGNEEEFKVDVSAILEEGAPDLDFPLESGDRIVVPARRITLF